MAKSSGITVALVKAVEDIISALHEMQDNLPPQTFAGTPEERLLNTLESALQTYKTNVETEQFRG